MHTKTINLPPLKKDDYKPLYAQVSEALLEYIKENNLKPGDPLPSELETMEAYGVSRATARIAFQRLATEGRICKVQGRGTFVAKPRISGFVYGLRTLEESLAEQGITITTIPLDVSVRLNPTQLWLKELSLPPESQVFRVFRLKKIGETPLAIENRYLPMDVAGIFPSQSLAEKPLIQLLNSRPETEIQRVTYWTRSEALLERFAEFLEAPPGSPCLIQGGTYYDRGQRPVLTGNMVFLADKIEIRYEYSKQENTMKKHHRIRKSQSEFQG